MTKSLGKKYKLKKIRKILKTLDIILFYIKMISKQRNKYLTVQFFTKNEYRKAALCDISKTQLCLYMNFEVFKKNDI